jgi:phosphoenolpyruvate synthase/pyruvate phosphate dikinase
MVWKMMIQAPFRLPFFMHLMSSGVHEHLERKIGYRFNELIWATEHSVLTLYSTDEEIWRMQKFLLENAPNKSFLLNIKNHINTSAAELLNHCDELHHSNFKKYSNYELAYELKKLSDRYKRHIAFYPFPKFVNDALTGYFEDKVSSQNEKYFSLLIKPRKHSVFAEEQKELLKIIIAIKNQKELCNSFSNKTFDEIKEVLARYYPEIDLMITEHTDNYCWFPIFDMHNPHTKEYYLSIIQESLKKDEDQDNSLNKMRAELMMLEKERQDAAAKLGLSEKDMKLADFMCEMSQLNEFRKSVKAQANYLTYSLLKEIAKRFGIGYIQLKYLVSEEIISMLKNPETFSYGTIEKRRKAWISRITENGMVFYEGDEAIDFIKNEIGQLRSETIKEIKGRIAQKGLAKGKVRLIFNRADISRLQQGEILVTSMTDPDMVMAMKKAAAIVTDEGGLTCHAAIVSRELGVPCIVGTENATHLLKDGEMVEVDADKGIVRKV